MAILQFCKARNNAITAIMLLQFCLISIDLAELQYIMYCIVAIQRRYKDLLNGQNISVIRKRKGLNQEELAHMLSVNTATLSRWENGHFEPKASVIKKLCEVLGCTESELLNGPDDGRVRLTLVYDWGQMKEGNIDMTGNDFELILGSQGQIGLKGAGLLTSAEAIDEFLSRVREQLTIALDAQKRRGAIPQE